MTYLYVYLVNAIESMLRREEGQGLVEYALIIGLVSIALVLVLQGLTGSLTNIFTAITNTLNAAAGS